MSVVRLLVLGSATRRQAVHGYRILSDLKQWRVETWTMVKPGSIYHAIGQLEKHGFLAPVKSSATEKLGPAKTEYALTAAGRSEFLVLVREALCSFGIEEYSAGIVFMEFLPRAEVVALLEARVASLREASKGLRKLPTELLPSEPSKHPELMNTWVSYLGDMAGATERTKERVQSGSYRYQGEEE